VRSGIVLRSRDMRTPFERGPTLIPPNAGRLRHGAVDVQGDLLRVYYSRIGDRPERILVSETRLTDDWQVWGASPPPGVLAPERDYEARGSRLRCRRQTRLRAESVNSETQGSSSKT